MLDEIPSKYSSQIKPADFYLPRLRYVDPAPYTQDQFDRAYNFMLSWDLVGKTKFENLVCNRVS
jgi:NitT/TauT family transport system substrate-binding protein